MTDTPQSLDNSTPSQGVDESEDPSNEQATVALRGNAPQESKPQALVSTESPSKDAVTHSHKKSDISLEFAGYV